METTNQLKHTIRTQTPDGNNIEIKIRLSDDCKNGHNDFSITGTVWNAPYWSGDRNMIAGGCCHDDILAARPDLKIFVDLHLADVTGAPMYAVANGFYHLTEGFNNTAPNHPNFKTEYCDYYRLSAEQFDVLSTSEDKTVFAYHLSKLGIVNQWKKQANEAIKILEELTGKKFKDNSTTLHEVELAPAELRRIDLKIQNGYYNPVNIKKRADDKAAAEKQKLFDDIKEELEKAIKKHTEEYNVKFAILSAGLPINNFIYYNHNNEGCFNWLDYHKKISKAEFDGFLDWVKLNPQIELPKNITFKLKP